MGGRYDYDEADQMHPVFCKRCRTRAPSAVSANTADLRKKCVQQEEQGRAARQAATTEQLEWRAAQSAARLSLAAAWRGRLYSAKGPTVRFVLVVGAYHAFVVRPLARELENTRTRIGTVTGDIDHLAQTVDHNAEVANKSDRKISVRLSGTQVSVDDLTGTVNYNADASHRNTNLIR